MNLLQEYRNQRSELLQKRLDIVKKISETTSIDIKEKVSDALQSERDRELLENLIKDKTFLVLPIMSTDRFNEGISHVYTIGCWYYWGIPEIFIKFKKPIKMKTNFVHTIISMVHDCLYTLYADKIIDKDNLYKINKLEFDPTESLNITDMNIQLDLTRVPDDKHIELNAGYMLWFYAFWVKADYDEFNPDEPKMYPVYTLEMDQTNVNQFIEGLANHLIKKMEKMKLQQTDTGSIEGDEEEDFDSDSKSEDS